MDETKSTLFEKIEAHENGLVELMEQFAQKRSRMMYRPFAGELAIGAAHLEYAVISSSMAQM